jgi:tRNA (guanine37-N1)-methyltransferase
MRIDVLTIFPKMFEGPFSESLLGKARQKGLVDLRVTDIRDHADNKHRSVDDRPYGGGPGMVMMAEPLFRALRACGVPARKSAGKGPAVIYLSPQGRPLTQKLADELAKKKRLVLLCGHYEGIDERLSPWIDLEISVGEAVYTGGEVPAMAVVDAVVRKLPGVVKEADSLKWDSFAEGWNGRLDCPHYTRPAVWRGKKVPAVLLSGRHEDIRRWRAEQSEKMTRQKRPNLLKQI